jgi:protein-L-isoaspartate(D-aspartate) O-methyltransferase
MIGRVRSATPSSHRRPKASSDNLDLLNAIAFQDRRVLRAVYGLPWHEFETGSRLTAERLQVLVRMLEALGLQGSETVLDIGTGDGHRAALLSRLAGRVQSIEVVPSVAAATRERLACLGFTNIDVIDGDGSLGFAKGAPFHGIIVGGASPDVPNELIAQLAEGARLVIPVGDARGQLIARVCRRGPSVESTTIAPCLLRPLAQRRARVTSVPWLKLQTG